MRDRGGGWSRNHWELMVRLFVFSAVADALASGDEIGCAEPWGARQDLCDAELVRHLVVLGPLRAMGRERVMFSVESICRYKTYQ